MLHDPSLKCLLLAWVIQLPKSIMRPAIGIDLHICSQPKKDWQGSQAPPLLDPDPGDDRDGNDGAPRQGRNPGRLPDRMSQGVPNLSPDLYGKLIPTIKAELKPNDVLFLGQEPQQQSLTLPNYKKLG